MLWPTSERTTGTFVAAKPIGKTVAKIVWVVIWGGFAVLNLQPAVFTSGGVHSMVSGMGSGQPGWVVALIDGFTGLSAGNGVPMQIVGAVIMALIAVAVFLPPAVLRVAMVAAVIVSAFIWVVGQALGGVFGGESTDVNSGPLLALLAFVYWPARVRVPSTTGADA